MFGQKLMDCPRLPSGQKPSKECWDAYLSAMDKKKKHDSSSF